MPAERFDFRNSEGHQLAALLDRPEGDVRAIALFAHCFTCGKHNRAARHIADGLKQRGIAVLRFDFTGLGESEGEFGAGLSSDVADVIYLQSGYYDAALERSIAFDDPAIGIEWPALELTVSERDRAAPPLAQLAPELGFPYPPAG